MNGGLEWRSWEEREDSREGELALLCKKAKKNTAQAHFEEMLQ